MSIAERIKKIPNASGQFVNRFMNPREVAREHELPPGRYVIVPCTFQADTEGEYVLRIFSEKQNQMQYAEFIIYCFGLILRISLSYKKTFCAL